MTEPPRIYLDNQATTRVDPRVLEAMLPFFTESYGNAASRQHAFGWDADAAVKESREAVAGVLGAEAGEVLFTSGATEANNLAILGAARAAADRGRHLVSCATEHPSVLEPLAALGREGWEVSILGVDRYGRLDLDELAAALRPDTVLVSVMHGNNEIGTLQPVERIGALCQERGILFHCDATQTVGKVPVGVDDWPVDLLSFSAHKMYGPKGVGGLFVRRRGRRVQIAPLVHGGGQERDLRPGTTPVPLIVGLARALALSVELRDTEQPRVRALRDRLQESILAGVDRCHVHGHPEGRLAGNLSLSFEFVEGEAVIHAMDGVAASSGAACSTGSLEPSHVLLALGLDRRLAHGSVRFSVGRFNTEEEIDRAAERAIAAVKALRSRSPLYQMAQEESPISPGPTPTSLRA